MCPLYTLLLLYLCAYVRADNNKNESIDPVLYYYGLEESERSLLQCEPRQACAAFVERDWRAPALVRLCRCARRTRCDVPAGTNARVHFNNRAYFQFCQPVTNWPPCSYGETPLSVQTTYERLNPDELEKLHHKNIHLVPPKIVFNCRCPEPNYYKLNDTEQSDDMQTFQCSMLPPCRSGQYCGNVNEDLYMLYQSCLCPKHHICVHDGGFPRYQISELLYQGKGWRAYCQRVGDFSYEDYYE